MVTPGTSPATTTTSPLDRRPHLSWFRVLGPLPGVDMAEGRLVWHPFHQRPCALRIISCKSEEEQRLLHKACQRLRRLNHPNLVQILDLVMLDEGIALLEDDDGGGYTLRQSLDEMGTLQLDEALSTFRQVLDGIAGLHRAGLVHGDLHPGHIRLDIEDGALHVRIRGIGPPLLGTDPTDDRYLAPERISGGALDRRVDVFALGTLFYESLAGRLPFDEADLWTRRKRIRAGELVPLQRYIPQLPMELVFAVDSALRGDPAQRFPDAGAFARAFPAQIALSLASGSMDDEDLSDPPEVTEVIDVPDAQTAEYVSGAKAPEPPPERPAAARPADAAERAPTDAAREKAEEEDAIGDLDEEEIKKHARPEEPPPEERRTRSKLGASSLDAVLGLSKAARLVALPLLLFVVFVAAMSASGFQTAQDQERKLEQIEDALNGMMQDMDPLAQEAIALGVEPNAVWPMLAAYRSASGRSDRQRAAETMAAGLLRLVRSLPETEDLQERERRRTLERRVNHLLSEIRNYKQSQSELESTSEEFFGAWLARFFR